MVLAIDVGNAVTTAGFIENGDILTVVHMQTVIGQTRAEYAVRLRQLMDFYGVRPGDFEGAIVTSVVPPVTEELVAGVRLLAGCVCILVGPGIKTGLNVRIDDPSTLAGDLVADSVAAIHWYGAPAIVLDMGTATVMAVIDAGGRYTGGAILPGVRSAYAALASGTSLLPDIAIFPPKKCIAANTVDAMRSGAVYGTASAIDGMIERMEAELGCRCRIVATGELAGAVAPCCRREITVDENLLLKGLWLLYERNSKK